jgi:hypothetical protein
LNLRTRRLLLTIRVLQISYVNILILSSCFQQITAPVHGNTLRAATEHILTSVTTALAASITELRETLVTPTQQFATFKHFFVRAVGGAVVGETMNGIAQQLDEVRVHLQPLCESTPWKILSSHLESLSFAFIHGFHCCVFGG